MIEQIGLRNFKAFANQTLKLKPLTLLSGLNSTGKSSVLQTFGLLRQSYDADMLDREGLMLNGDLLELGTCRDVLHEGADKAHIEVTLTIDGVESRWVGDASRRMDDALPLLDRPSNPPVHPLFLRGHAPDAAHFQLIRADRLNPAVYYPKSRRSAHRDRFLGSRGEYTAHFLSLHEHELVAEQLRCEGSDATPGLLAQVSAWMQEFSPGVRIEVADIPNTDFVRLAFGYGTSGGLSSTGSFRPTNVGFGLSYVLPILVACLAARPGSVILLENPEAHLHPRGQSLMGQLAARVAAAGAQVVVESHSDHVLNGMRIAVKNGIVPANHVAAHFFTRKAGELAPHVASPQLNAQGMIDEWPDGFFDEWDRNLDSLLA